MKFVLAFAICSAVSGSCEPLFTTDKKFDTWSECVGHGGALIIDFSIEMKEHADKNKLFISYFCTEQPDLI